MDCENIRPLIAAHLDGELDVVRDAEVAAHLDQCRACAEAALFQATANGLVQTKAERFKAPADLLDSIQKALRAESRPTTGRSRLLWFPASLGLAASLALAVFIGFSWGRSTAGSDALIREAIADHIRSLQADHLTDVVSTDRHTVKPWFDGKVAFSPPVFDLAAKGFPLIGGRLDFFGGHPAAALVFHRRLHVINLYVWPVDARTALSARTAEHDGYHVVTWSAGGFNFLAVSDVAPEDLAEFCALYKGDAE